MLSRAAERVYWTGRYLERAENTARIVQQYSQLLLDLPDEVGVQWRELVRVVGADDEFRESGRESTERDILEFLLVDAEDYSSLAYSLRMARENIRNTRDLLPQESWESVNELFQFAIKNLHAAARGENRFEILSECIGRCLQINGILTGTMSHHSPYQFLRLGQNLERADMTSRIIDVAATYVQQNDALILRYGSSLWTNVLKSVSGFQMYRQYCQPQVEGLRVIEFLLRDPAFPRAVARCSNRARTSVNKLPQSAATIAALNDLDAMLADIDVTELDATSLTALMDMLQKHLGDVHQAVVDSWFLPDEHE
jgi:uncharacterized alpha-E superfamily protein